MHPFIAQCLTGPFRTTWRRSKHPLTFRVFECQSQASQVRVSTPASETRSEIGRDGPKSHFPGLEPVSNRLRMTCTLHLRICAPTSHSTCPPSPYNLPPCFRQCKPPNLTIRARGLGTVQISVGRRERGPATCNLNICLTLCCIFRFYAFFSTSFFHFPTLVPAHFSIFGFNCSRPR